MNFVIEKNVPIPPSGAGKQDKGGLKLTAVMRSLSVGDSFMAPNVHPGRICARAANLKPMKFLTRQIDGGTRCWRVA